MTQAHRRQAKGVSCPMPGRQARHPENFCVACGSRILPTSKHCAKCSIKSSAESLIAGRELGRRIARGELAQARRKESKRRHDLARRRWSAQAQPDWLNEDTYKNLIQPRLTGASLSQIASALGVSIPYASDIRKRRRQPHPRHWSVLAELVGVYGPGN